MAKSKSGGSRGMLKGRLASDVYTVGRDGKGKKQQVVRSLAEQVANPQTPAQMANRMVMYTVGQAMKALAPLIDHSFDAVPAGQPCVSEFIARNYKLAAADAAAHPSADNTFGMQLYGTKGAKGGAYVISAGKAYVPKFNNNTISGSAATVVIDGAKTDGTMGDFLDSLPIAAGDYITILSIKADGTMAYGRVTLNAPADSTAAYTAELAEAMFVSDNVKNTPISVAMNGSKVELSAFTGTGSEAVSSGAICSQKKGSKWIHSNSTMLNVAAPANTASVAILTYPVGTQKFLNGGE